MSQALKRRVARLERARHGRQFGDDPREKPSCALVATVLWELESNPNSELPELIKVRRLCDAEEIDAAFNLLGVFFLQPAFRGSSIGS